MRARFLLPIWGVFLLACEDPLAYPQDIERLRVLGARTSVNGDSSRAWPASGDTVSLEWLVAAPEPEPSVGWYFEACPSHPGSRGLPECAGDVLASASAGSPSSEPPRFDFTLGEVRTERVLVNGLVCRDGLVGSLGASCAGEQERVLFEIPIADPTHQNANPTLSDAPIFLGDQPWQEATPSELAQADCSATEAPLTASTGAEQDIRIDLDASDRDVVSQSGDLVPKYEPLFLSHFATEGRLARPLSVVEGDSNQLSVHVRWRAPRDGAGERVRFYFVLRDGRGGVDWSARTLCLVP